MLPRVGRVPPPLLVGDGGGGGGTGGPVVGGPGGPVPPPPLEGGAALVVEVQLVADARDRGRVHAAVLAARLEQPAEDLALPVEHLVPDGHGQERAFAVARSLALRSASASSSLVIFERPSMSAALAC